MNNCERCIYRNTETCLDRVGNVYECYQESYTKEQLIDEIDDIAVELYALSSRVSDLRTMIEGLNKSGKEGVDG